MLKKNKAPSGVDTVENAQQEPDKEQPWKELGLKKDEYESIKEILGSRPT